MKQTDLQGIIRDMATRIDSYHVGDEHSGRRGLLSEVEAYMSVDSTLASLYKQYLDARNSRVRALQQAGEDSAMAAIARDLEESAQSAIETRMIELRADKLKRMNAEHMMAEAHLAELAETRSDRARFYARQQQEHYAQERRQAMAQDQARQDGEDSYMMMVMMWWMMRRLTWRTQVKLSLASRFAKVSDRENELAVTAA